IKRATPGQRPRFSLGKMLDVLFVLGRTIELGAGDRRGFPLAVVGGRRRNLLDDQIDRPASPEFRHAVAYLRRELTDMVPQSVTNRGPVLRRLAFGPKPVDMQHPDQSVLALDLPLPGFNKKLKQALAVVLHLQDINEQQKPAVARPPPIPNLFGQIRTGDLADEMQRRALEHARPRDVVRHLWQPAEPR